MGSPAVKQLKLYRYEDFIQVDVFPVSDSVVDSEGGTSSCYR